MFLTKTRQLVVLFSCLVAFLFFGVFFVSAADVNINATIPGSGSPPPPPPPPPDPILGCTNPSATNYNPSATVDDGSCVYPVYGCIDPTALNYNPSANTGDGSCIYAVYGCTDPTAINYNSNANQDDGSCVYSLLGCTDSSAINYNANATDDDGSCIYSLLGCTDADAINYNANATDDDGSCIIEGCTDTGADNYKSKANLDDGSCIYFGCTNTSAINYDSTANQDDGSCIILGCTNLSADNYNSSANQDDGSCIISGCTNINSTNYNSLATVDDGSCIISGCTDPTAVNYNINATIDNGLCSYDEELIPGCTDASASNFNANATIDNGSCIYPVFGCTDPSALNYNPLAVVNNGSCVFSIPTLPEPTVVLGGSASDYDPQFYFYTNNNGLQIFLGGVRNNNINLLVGNPLTILISDKFPQEVGEIYAIISGQKFIFKHDLVQDRYLVDLNIFNKSGDVNINLFVKYKNGFLKEKVVTVIVHPLGKVFIELPEDETILYGASIYLYDENGNVVMGLPKMPEGGLYGFMVPDGRYKIVVFNNGKIVYESKFFYVKNNIVNKNLGLSWWEIFIETATKLLNDAGDLAKNNAIIINDKVLNNPVVEETNKYTAPVVVSAVSISTAIAIPWWSFVHYLQYFFTEPLAWLFRRKKKGWGVVYNAITKKPIDLAVVRLYDQATKRLLKSKVTDRQGRYNFLVSEGSYYIEVVKPKMIFPSEVLKSIDEDKQFTDIYHGEVVNIGKEQRGIINANVPVDPEDLKISDKEILKKHFWYKVKKNINAIGPVFAVVSFSISPSILIGFFTLVHLILYLLFKRLAAKEKSNKWGVVLDSKTNNPISGAVAKIYSPEYNKMLEAQVTDRHGRYGFLAGNNVYYLAASKDGYKDEKTETIDLIHKKSEEVIGQDIKLKPANESGEGDINEENIDKKEEANNNSLTEDLGEKSNSINNSDTIEAVEQKKEAINPSPNSDDIVKESSSLEEIAEKIKKQQVEKLQSKDINIKHGPEGGKIEQNKIDNNDFFQDENKFG